MSDEATKRMAEYLKSGATMLSEECPNCHVPLFRLKGEVLCPKCGARVILVKSDEEMVAARTPIVLEDVEETVVMKIRELNDMLKRERDLEELDQLGSLLSTWLDVLGKVREIRRRGTSGSTGERLSK